MCALDSSINPIYCTNILFAYRLSIKSQMEAVSFDLNIKDLSHGDKVDKSTRIN